MPVISLLGTGKEKEKIAFDFPKNNNLKSNCLIAKVSIVELYVNKFE